MPKIGKYFKGFVSGLFKGFLRLYNAQLRSRLKWKSQPTHKYLTQSQYNCRRSLVSIFSPNVRALIQKEWQAEWDLEVDNKLNLVKPLVGELHSYSPNTHMAQMVTRRFLLWGDDALQTWTLWRKLNDFTLFLCVCPSLNKLRRK